MLPGPRVHALNTTLPYFSDNGSSVGELLETDLLRVPPHRVFGCMMGSPSTGPAPPLPIRLTSSPSLRAWRPWAVAKSRQMLSPLPWPSSVFLLASSLFSSQAQRSKAHTPEGARLTPACPQFSLLRMYPQLQSNETVW